MESDVRWTGSPVDDGREELGDERLVVWAQLLDVRGLVGLAVQVVRVESAYGIERLLVLLVHEVGVSVLAVPPNFICKSNVSQYSLSWSDKMRVGKQNGVGSGKKVQSRRRARARPLPGAGKRADIDATLDSQIDRSATSRLMCEIGNNLNVQE